MSDSNWTSFRICEACINDVVLKSRIKERSEWATCDFCESLNNTIGFGELVSSISEVLDAHFEPFYGLPNDMSAPDAQPVSLKEAVCRIAGINEDVAIHVLSRFESQARKSFIDTLDPEEMNSPDFHERLAEISVAKLLYLPVIDDRWFHESWKTFEGGVQNEFRYFNKNAEALLHNLLGDLVQQAAANGTPVLVPAGPGHSISEIIRGRVFQSSEALVNALKEPEVALGPPSSRQATAGRMNAHGIAAFYAATDEQTVLAEVRPPVGSRVLIGRFRLLRDILLLDVSALGKILVHEGSYFDPGFIVQLQRAKFLQRLRDRIAKPVLPDDQPLDYLVTQVIADYLANAAPLSLDGVIYPSSQKTGAGLNVVLFHKAARVANPKFRSSSPPAVHLRTAGSWEYSVHETYSEGGKTAAVDQIDWSEIFNPLRDKRVDTLELDPMTLAVHEIKSVTVEAERRKVWRYRGKEGAPFSLPINPG